MIYQHFTRDTSFLCNLESYVYQIFDKAQGYRKHVSVKLVDVFSYTLGFKKKQWRGLSNQENGRNFCINFKNKHNIQYPNISLVAKRISNSEILPQPLQV